MLYPLGLPLPQAVCCLAMQQQVRRHPQLSAACPGSCASPGAIVGDPLLLNTPLHCTAPASVPSKGMLALLDTMRELTRTCNLRNCRRSRALLCPQRQRYERQRQSDPNNV